MKKAAVAFVCCVVALSNVSARESVEMKVAPVETDGSIFLPDFAYPKDVVTTARAFLEANPASEKPYYGGSRLLAAQEEALATLDIDNMAINEVVGTLLKLADNEIEPASKAMFLAYTSSLCKQVYYRASGYISTPDPAQVDKWDRAALSQASDSLLKVAYRTAPVDASLLPYASALNMPAPEVGLVTTVRDFVYSLMNSGQRKELKATGVAVPSRLDMYYSVYDFADDNARKNYILDNLGNKEIPYFIASYILYVGSPARTAENLEFLEKVSDAGMPAWLQPTLDSAIRYLKATQWTLTFESYKVAGMPFELSLTSSNTDSVEVNIYKADALNKPFSRVSLAGSPGVTEKKTVTEVTLPAGKYIARVPALKGTPNDSVTFYVTPWQVYCVQPDPQTRMIQVVDAITGLPAGGVKVRVEKVDNKSRKPKYMTSVTDNQGVVGFDKPIYTTFTLLDSKDKTEYEVRCNGWLYLWQREEPEEERIVAESSSMASDSEPDVHITLERGLYHPGDTVKWLAVAQNDVSTVEGASFPLEITFPAEKGKKVEGIEASTGKTDRYGRIAGEFVIPKDCPPGSGVLTIDYSDADFTVSEFRLPEIGINENKFLLEGDSVRITGIITNNVGAPRAETPVVLKYGDVVDTVRTNIKGVYDFVIPRHLPGMQPKSPDNWPSYIYYSLEAFTPDGYNTTARGSFPTYKDVDLWIESKKIINVADGFSFEVKSKRLGVSDADAPLDYRWFIMPGNYRIPYNLLAVDETKALVSGTARTGSIVVPQAFCDTVTPGRYFIAVEPSNGVKGYVTTFYVTMYDTRKPQLPDNSVFWLPDANFTQEGDSISITVGVGADNTCLWWTDHYYSGGKINNCILHKGFQKLKLYAPHASSLSLWSVKNGKAQLETVMIEKGFDKDEGLTVTLESFRDNAVAGTTQRWDIVTRFDGKPVGAALALNVYERRLENLWGEPSPLEIEKIYPTFNNTKVFYTDIRQTTFISDYGAFLRKPVYPPFETTFLSTRLFPSWRFRFTPYNHIVKPSVTSESVTADNRFLVKGIAMVNQSAKVESRAHYALDMTGTATSRETVIEELAESVNSDADVPLREGLLYNALWRPMLSTDSVTGRATVDFVLPNQASQWVLTATAWTRDLDSKHVTRNFTADKPLYVKPNLPRFVRVGDRVDIMTALTNSTDSALTVSYRIEGIREPVTGRIELPAKSTRYVTTPIAVDGGAALSDTLDFTFRASTGLYGDGERVRIPILPSTALVIESRPFYMNPGDSLLTLAVPSGDAENELHFTANPMWTVVESMNAFLKGQNVEETCLSTDLAQAWYIGKTYDVLLNTCPQLATVMSDGDDFRKMRTEALAKLNDFSRGDGGLSWTIWSPYTSLYATLTVLEWMDEDTTDTELRKFIDKALDYVDKAVTQGMTKNSFNLHYALVRGAYGNPEDAAAQTLIAYTVNHILKNWKTMSLNDKCVSALILARNDRKADAVKILESVRQYGVITADRGLVFPNTPGIAGYATMLQAFHSLLPDDTAIADAIRQALLCQRRGASWGASGHAAYAIRALVTAGTQWMVPSEGVTISVDGKNVSDESFRTVGAETVPVNGAKVTVSRTDLVTPAYGALVSRRVMPLADVPAFGTKQLSLVKTLYVQTGKGYEAVTSTTDLHPGQKIVVNLRVYTDTEMTDVRITDNRSSAFEPVDQKPGYMPLVRKDRSFVRPFSTIINGKFDTSVYIDRLPRGYSEFEYEVIVNNSGTFTTGVATLLSGEDPDLTVHSASTLINVIVLKD